MSTPDAPDWEIRATAGDGRSGAPLQEANDAAGPIREAAWSFTNEERDIRQLWSVFRSHLYDLCAEGPLDGDFLHLFKALENWEAPAGAEKFRAIEGIHEAAARLAKPSE